MKTKSMMTLLISLLLTAGTSSALTSREILLDASGIEKDAILTDLRCDRVGGAIMLDNSQLYEDDAPATGVPEGYAYNGPEWKEDLVKGIVIKKTLLIDDPRALSGRLLIKAMEVKGNTTTLHISINGTKIIRPATAFAAPLAKQFTMTVWDRWFYVDVPVGSLKQGENEILMWTESEEQSWRILVALEEEFARGSIERPHHPNRSMKSKDGGRTWSDAKLGATDAVDGEYSVRISLDHYVPKGGYVSPVMDVIDGDGVLKKLVKVSEISLKSDIETPDETSADVRVRFGSSPLISDSSWTEWAELTAGTLQNVSGDYRYIQWKAELSTSNPLVSPKITSFFAKAEYEDISPNALFGVAAHVEKNGHVARSSVPFGYEDLKHPGLKKYRTTYKLDKIIEGADTEFEIMMRLLNWSYRIPVTSDQYSWDWNNVPLLVRDEDGMPKLQMEYPGRRRDAMCLYSNQALVGAMLAYGFQARHINIHSEGMSGHEVTEVWSNDFNKWIYMDATRDYYYFEPDTGVPLNLLEIHNKLIKHIPRVETWQRPFAFELADQVGVKINVGLREGNNPFSIVEQGTHIMEIMGHFRIIPRNNFLSQPLPVPIHTGATMWGWDGFLNYYDEKFPKLWEYQLQTDRALDFYEPLNQSEVFLSETATRGVLNVEVDTFTPGGFDTFLMRVNEGKWMESKKPSWEWALAGGIQSLDVRTRNVRGILGPVSTVRVTYNP